MAWTMEQRTGRWLDAAGVHRFTGYSGFGEGKNNPELQHVANLGPLPRGSYRIGPAYDHPKLGHEVMNLDPLFDTETFGRDLFRIHGESSAHPGASSHGCPILNRPEREAIAESGDNQVDVVE